MYLLGIGKTVNTNLRIVLCFSKLVKHGKKVQPSVLYDSFLQYVYWTYMQDGTSFFKFTQSHTNRNIINTMTTQIDWQTKFTQCRDT